MSRKLKFKIISCSSQEPQYPVSSLMFTGSQGWQTKRFCTYPQQITLQFYGIVNIRKLQLVSDHRKISSQVDILYYVPISQQEERFYKYGYLQFSRSQGGNAKQLKTIMVDLNCLYIRFLFHKPHSSRQNFFSQIGIQSLTLYGSEHVQSLVQEPSNVRQQDDDAGVVNQEDQQYILGIMATLASQKQNAIRQQDFETANYYKNTISLINNLADKLKMNRNKIQKSLQAEDYDTAKLINDQIKKIKAEISQILDNKPEQMSPEPQMEDNQFANVSREQNNGNQFMEPEPKLSPHLELSRKSNKIVNTSNSNVRPIKTQNQQQYDQRVIPALRSDKLKTQNDEFAEQKPKDLPPPQEVQGKFIKQATMMQDFFDQDTIRKYFSQYWQHNLQSLNTILNQIKVKHKQPGLVKCLIIVVKYSLQQINFQVAQQSLSLFSQMLKINANTQSITKPGQLQNDLDQIGKEVIKKLSDNNPKIKTAAEQAFAQMISSLLYGVQSCCSTLSKSKTKLSSKQVSTRLTMITKMIDQYGIATGANSVPLISLDFAIQNINNPSEQVRKYAVSLLSMAYKKDKEKTSQKINVLKQSIIQQIQGNALTTPQKPKKK